MIGLFPIISFSLTSRNSRRDGSASRGSNFINLLLQSFGVTITDSNDIIFRCVCVVLSCVMCVHELSYINLIS